MSQLSVVRIVFLCENVHQWEVASAFLLKTSSVSGQLRYVSKLRARSHRWKSSTIMLTANESEPFLRESEKASLEHHHLSTPAAFRRSSSKYSHLTTHLLVLVVSSLFWGGLLLFFITRRPLTHEPVKADVDAQFESSETKTLISGARYLLCGNSTDEAKDVACEYDILSNHWLPAPCMDQEAVREYQSDGSWFGYADEERTRLLSIDAMSEAPFYYTNMRDHILHCAMLWRKQYRAFFEERKGLDSILVDEEHTLHCSDFLVRMTEHGPDFSKIPIKVEVGYAGCHVRG